MPMSNNDQKLRTRDEIRAAMMQALKDNDAAAYSSAFDEMMQRVAADLTEANDARLEEIRQNADAAVLAQRGVRQLTSEERKFYQTVITAMKSGDPKQGLSGGDAIMPRTVIDAVFDELQTRHPLLSRISFRPSGGAVDIITASNGYQKAVWGELCAEIVTELLAGFTKIPTMLCKLSAFLPVCKAMLELGPTWLDQFVREVLYEALANGLEYGIVTGTGKSMPIGMDRQVGAGVTVTDGVYPKKTAVALNDFSPASVGNLLALLAIDGDGKPREVRDVILLVNPADYFSKVMPATTVMAPDGSYRNDVLPYPMTIIQTQALDQGDAVVGIAYRYLAVAGTAKEGRIEYSDHYHFLEDERVYLIKAYANGMPLDNNAFLLLDISGLTPLAYKVVAVDARTPSDDATLASLKLGTLTLSPTFDPAVDTYTSTTTAAKNSINAVPADAGATMVITLNGAVVQNGSQLTWSSANSGVNVVHVIVTAEDGTTQEDYTITVTKS